MESNQTNPLSSESSHRKRKFTTEEDEQIKQLVQLHGPKQWDVIAKSLNNRSARQCRDRWKHYLSPTVSLREWTLEEDRLLLQYTSQFGAQWAGLVKFFPGRTDVNLKNRWNKLQRKSRKLTNLSLQINPQMADGQQQQAAQSAQMQQQSAANGQSATPQPQIIPQIDETTNAQNKMMHQDASQILPQNTSTFETGQDLKISQETDKDAAMQDAMNAAAQVGDRSPQHVNNEIILAQEQDNASSTTKSYGIEIPTDAPAPQNQ